MPFPVIAAIAAGSSLLNTASQARANKQNQKFQRQQYERQRADDLAFWNMQNQYNSPQQQMQRLKEAGLNPNLAYGSVNNEAAKISAPNVAPARNEAPEFNLGPAMSQYFDIQQSQQQTDNLRKQNELLEIEKTLKQANVLQVLANTDLKKFDLQRGQTMLQTQLDALKASMDRNVASAQMTRDSNRRAEEKQPLEMEAIIRSNELKYQQARTEPLKRQVLRNTANQILENTQLVRLKQISEKQKIQLASTLAETAYYKAKLAGKQVTAQQIANDIARIRAAGEKASMTIQQTQSIIDLVFPFRGLFGKTKYSSTSKYDREGNYRGGTSTETRE